jgi:hypothetical protein
MTTAYDALLASASPEFVVLVEAQAMEPLGVWTKEGAFVNVYSCALAPFIATAVVPGGLYRRLDSVREDSTALTSRASAALVDANLGSYYYDAAAAKLYVATSTGSSPEVFAVLGAWFTVLLSTSTISFSDQPLYTPLLTGELPALESEMPDAMFGATSAAVGNLTILNGDGLFDTLSKLWTWRNKQVIFKLGGVGLAYADFATIAVMRINGIQVNDEQAVLTLEDMGTILNQTLPPTYRTWTGGDGGEHPKQMVFGTVEACPLVYVSTDGLNRDLWGGWDALFNTVSVGSVYAVERATGTRTLLTETTDYTIAPIVLDTYVRIISGGASGTYSHLTHDIIATLTETNFPHFGECALRILRMCGESDANIDTAAFSAILNDLPTGLGRYVNTAIAATELMEELCRSVNGQVYRGVDGRWTIRALAADVPASFVTLADADFVSWEPQNDLVSVLGTVVVRYNHQPFGDVWTSVSSSDSAVTAKNETSDSHQIDTWHLVAEQAAVHADRMRFLRSAAPSRIAFEARGLELMAAYVGDLVSVTRARGPVARTGSYDGHLLRIIQLRKALGPDGPTVSGVLDDLDGQADRIARCYTGDLDWSAATAAQRAVYGFCADADHYIDPADRLTKDLKVTI